jgi:hypothetical protein
MSGIKHKIAVGMNDLGQILDYFRGHSDSLSEAIRDVSLAMEALMILLFLVFL